MKKDVSKANSKSLDVRSDLQDFRGGLSRAILPSILIASALSLVGCAGHSKNHFTVGSVPSNYKKNHPIIVDEKEQVLDIPIASSAYDLPLASASSVEGFAQAFNTSQSKTITVLIPTRSPNETAARNIVASVVHKLNQTGIATHRIRKATYNASKHGSAAPIRLSYNAITASVNGCGRWPEDMVTARRSENKNYHNFGCGSQSNLAAMVSNPADLLGPRGATAISAERRTVAIENYKSGAQREVSQPGTLFPR